jgi:phage terminase small subunit
MPPKKRKRLTLMQQLFVDALLADPNLSQAAAAIKAGYGVKSADSIASRLVKLPQVQAAIDREMAARARRTNISKDSTLRRIDSLSKANIKNVADWDTGGKNFTLKASKDLTEEEAFQIESIDVRTWTTLKGREITRTRIKIRKPDPALLMLGRHQGLFDVGDQSKPNAELEEAIKALDAEEKRTPVETSFRRIEDASANSSATDSQETNNADESAEGEEE